MVAPIFRIALRDLRRGYQKFWIFFSCLVLGVTAITAVTVMSASLINGIERDGRIILGGDLAVGQQFRELTNDEYQFLVNNSANSTHYIELNTLFRTPSKDNSILIALKAVDDSYPLYGAFDLVDGGSLQQEIKMTDGVWGALIEPSLIESGRAQVGDLVYLGQTQFRINGVIESEPDRAGSDERFSFWPRVVVHRDSLAKSGLLAEGSRSQFEYRLALSAESELESVHAAMLDEFPQLEIRDYRNASPELSDIISRIGVLLSLAGLTTLLIGGVGVSNAVRAYMGTRLATIAILKCVGASLQLVFRIYLIQIGLISILGVLAGMLIGWLTAVLVASTFEQALSIPIALTFNFQELSLVAIYGLLVALLFTLQPLARALNTEPAALFRNVVSNESHATPRKFIFISAVIAVALAVIVITTAYERSFAVWFVIGITGSWLAFRVLSALIIVVARAVSHRLPPKGRLALTNLHRPGSSTNDIVLAVGLGLSVLIATAMVSANLDRQISSLIPEKAPSFFFVGIQSAQFEEFREMLSETEGVTDVSVLPYIRGRITRIKGLDPYDALISPDGEWLIDDGGERAFSYSTEPPGDGDIIEGEWWPADYAGEPLLSIHKDVADSFGLSLGDEISLNVLGREITGRVHNVRDLEWRSMRLNFAIMLSPEPLRQIPHSSVATAYADNSQEFELQDRVASTFPNITVIRVKDALERVSDLILRARNAARGISLVTVVAGILVLAGIVVSENRRRSYESVLLKTVGASRRYILSVFSFEYLLQGGVTAIVAIIMGSVASWSVMTQLMGWDWEFMLVPALNTAVLGLAISLSLGMVGIWKALKQRALYHLRNE